MVRTRAADFEDKRQGLLRSAARVLAELGPDKASMAQIAARSGVSKALLYHYYPSKDSLVFEIIRVHLGELDDRLAAVPDGPPEQRLAGLVRAMLDVYRDADDLHTIQLNGKRALPAEAQAEITLIERRIVARFSRALAEANPALAKNPLLAPVTMSLFGMLNWVYMWFRDDGPLGRDAYADLATALILDGARSLR